jgi:hypothetical protein
MSKNPIDKFYQGIFQIRQPSLNEIPLKKVGSLNLLGNGSLPGHSTEAKAIVEEENRIQQQQTIHVPFSSEEVKHIVEEKLLILKQDVKHYIPPSISIEAISRRSQSPRQRGSTPVDLDINAFEIGEFSRSMVSPVVDNKSPMPTTKSMKSRLSQKIIEEEQMKLLGLNYFDLVESEDSDSNGHSRKVVRSIFIPADHHSSLSTDKYPSVP